jgi:uncharacterized protein involved in exopolysaccharide biosynthesis
MQSSRQSSGQHSVSESDDLSLTKLESLNEFEGSNNGLEGDGPRERSFSAFEITRLLWMHRGVVLRGTLWTLLAFTLIAFLIPKKYTATTRLMPPDYGSNLQMTLALPALSDSASSGTAAAGGSIMGLASQLLGLNTSGDLFVGVLQSQSVEDRIIQKFNLMDVYSVRHIEDARDALEDRTEITIKRSGIINLSVEDKSRERSTEIARMYVAELDRALAMVNTSAAHRERVFIEGRLKDVKQGLDATVKEFAAFSSQNAAIDVPEQAKAMVGAAAELQAQLIAAQSEVKGLQEIYTENNVRVKALKAHVNELERQLNKFGGKDVNLTRDTSLAATELYPSIRQLPLLGVKYLDLYRRTKINEGVYEFLTKEFEIARVQEAREIPTVQVLDVAVVPDKKSSPHRLLIMLAGLFLGFIGSGGWVIGMTLWEDADDSDPRKVLVADIYHTAKRYTWDTQFWQTQRRRVRDLAARFSKDSSTKASDFPE